MSEIHRTVTIAASAERVLEFLEDPVNIPTYAPGVRRVLDVARTERRVGDTFRVTYKMLGITFDESVSVTAFVLPPKATPHRRYQIQRSFAGAMKGSLTWTLEAQYNETDASVDVRYELGGGVLGKTVDALLLKRVNEMQIERMLDNMKRLLAPQPTFA